jgi:RNA polymerase sigma factor (TIGR02999 family)
LELQLGGLTRWIHGSNIPFINDLTQILKAAQWGDARAAEELLPLVYGELRKLAAAKMANEAPNQTLQPTALVHEAWLRLAGNENQKWDGRAHFFAAAAEAMRRILIDNARRKNAAKHGGGLQPVDLEEIQLASAADDTQLLRINEALEMLAADYPASADVVKLRFFVGMTNEQCAQALGISERTVKRHWTFAKAWLYDQLQPR